MQAPETVPSLYQLGTAWQKSMERSPFLKDENMDYYNATCDKNGWQS